MANPQVVVDFVANTKDLSAGTAQASRQTSTFGASLKSMGKTAALAAGAAGLAALTAAVKIGIEEYSESQKVMAQTNAVIKSTGGVANVTAKEVSGLAEELMKKSGVDDELIASGENVLLTFRNIRNEAGKGNDIFTQATKATLDLSVAMGKDMTSSALLVGKALNDPIAGMGALSRAGVQFTKAQKEQITALAESGKTMEAQKIILAELRKEFGGSAVAAGKTLPGQLAILKETFNNLAGELVAKLVPILQRTIVLLRDNWPQISAVFNAVWANIKPTLIAMGTLIAEVAGFIKANWSTIGPIVIGVAKVMTLGMRIMGGVIMVFVAILRGDWAAAWRYFKQTVEAAVSAVKGLLVAYMNLFKALVSGAWHAIRSATSSAWSGVVSAVRGAIEGVKDLMRGLVGWISDLGRGVLAAALGRVGAVFDRITDGARDAYNAVRNVLNNMVEFVHSIAGRVGNAASSIANALKGPLNAVIRAWNSLGIPRVSINLPSVKVLGKRIGGGSFGFGPVPFPDIPTLAKGGVVTQPTLAMVGERGPEAVVPLDRFASQPVNVRVFIGDQELRGLVRTVVDDSNTGIARTLLAR